RFPLPAGEASVPRPGRARQPRAFRTPGNSLESRPRHPGVCLTGGDGFEGAGVVERHEQLTDALAQHGGWATAADLSARLGVTDRSIRGYVSALNAAGETPLIDSGPLGYRLDRTEWG